MHSIPVNNLVKFILLTILSLGLTDFAHAQKIENETEDVSTDSISEAALMLSQYIAIPSETGNENLAAYFFRNLCSGKGLFVETINDTIGSVNFAASVYPLNLKKPNIIFLNHIDVVPANHTTEWIYPPYSGTIADNKVWGRGALDNKGLAIIQLFAIEKYLQQAAEDDLPYNITVLAVSGEETGGITGAAIVANGFQEKFTPAVVIGEGGSGIDSMKFLPPGKTFFGVSVVEKGFLWLELSCMIHSEGHASVAGNDYAIKRLVDGLHKLAKARQPIQFSPVTKQMFRKIGKNTGGLKGFAIKHINWKVFRPFLRRQFRQNHELESILSNNITISDLHVSTSAYNQIPQEARAILDCRYLPNNHPDEIIATVKKIINDTLIHVSIVHQGSIQYETTPDFFYDELKKAIVQVFPDAEVAPILVPASNDNSYFRASGSPVYGLFPMIISARQIKAVHNANEYIDLEDLKNGIQVFLHFLQSVQDSGQVPNPEELSHH